MAINPDGIIAGRRLDSGRVTWSHKYDMNVVFVPPDDSAVCSSCGAALIAGDGKWHPVRLKDGKYYCENCPVTLPSV